MDITYNTGGLEGLVAEGQITGSFGVFNHINLENAIFNRSTNEIQIDVKNTGDNTTDSISYTVEANNTDYNGTLPNLDAGEKAQINITTDEIYPLKSVNLDTEGTRFVDSSSGLKCTPTKGQVGYWSFNDEQTQNGYALDLSGQGNNGSLNGGVTTGVDTLVGEGYRFDGSDDFIDLEGQINPESSEPISIFAKVKETKEGGSSIINNIKWQRRGIRFNIDSNNPFSAKMGNENTKIGVNKKLNSPNSFNSLQLDYNGSSVRAGLNGDIVGKADLDFSNSSVPLNIGVRQINNEIYFKGTMDEIRIYNRSLSQNEIQRLYEVRSEGWAVSGCRLTGV